MRQLINLFVALIVFWGCSPNAKYADLQKSLNDFVENKDANIGIAVIIDSRDTISVNGDEEFPMLSVYKFPIALALAEQYRQNNMSLEYPITISQEDLHLDTYSPMTEKILASGRLITGLNMPTIELLGYMLQHSDNNASDIILNVLDSIGYVDKYLNEIGITDINVKNSEHEMHIDNSLCCQNSATPIAMASLMDRFDRKFNDTLSLQIKHLLETCRTGDNRLAKPLISTNAVLGHKTGTGFTLPDGRLMAINDAGYVRLPNGHHYSIVVFIKDSGHDVDTSEELIAEISLIVYSNIK